MSKVFLLIGLSAAMLSLWNLWHWYSSYSSKRTQEEKEKKKVKAKVFFLLLILFQTELTLISFLH
jgi:hypothetical protein